MAKLKMDKIFIFMFYEIKDDKISINPGGWKVQILENQAENHYQWSYRQIFCLMQVCILHTIIYTIIFHV